MLSQEVAKAFERIYSRKLSWPKTLIVVDAIKNGDQYREHNRL